MRDFKKTDLLINVSLRENGISTTVSFDKDSALQTSETSLPSETSHPSDISLAHMLTPENVNALVRAIVRKFNKDEKIVFIKHGNKLIKVDSEEIVRLEAARNYCDIILQDKTVLDVSMPMNEVHELLDSNLFYRINRSNVINIRYIKEFIGNMVRLSDEKVLDISDKYRTEIFSLLKIIGSRKRVKETKDKLL